MNQSIQNNFNQCLMELASQKDDEYLKNFYNIRITKLSCNLIKNDSYVQNRVSEAIEKRRAKEKLQDKDQLGNYITDIDETVIQGLQCCLEHFSSREKMDLDMVVGITHLHSVRQQFADGAVALTKKRKVEGSDSDDSQMKTEFLSAKQELSKSKSARRVGLSAKKEFKSPFSKKPADSDAQFMSNQAKIYGTGATANKPAKETPAVDERLANIDPRMVEMISNEIMETDLGIGWDDIAGLSHAKATIKESVIWPMQRPDIFTGLRGPPKGILLYGPPGTGKTLVGKCIASSSGATFFSISSSSLTSKYVGDGEKMVRALFAVARVHQPSVIFIDEIDSLLTQRTDGEFDATRRIKTEFLVQFDGCATSHEDRILLIGATNRPSELDEAARRRFRKKLYIPLPDFESRCAIVSNLLKKQSHTLSSAQMDELCRMTEGYSGSDMDNVCREAALGPIRSIGDIASISAEDVRPIEFSDFQDALLQVRASVSPKDLEWYVEFDKEHGSVCKK